MADKNYYLEEEAIIIRNSGEIPEVAYHGSIFYLTEDPEGPKLMLTKVDHAALKKMVVARYHEIIRRDLLPENRNKTIYRGLARSFANWLRLKNFCRQEDFGLNVIKEEIAALLKHFLNNEAKEIRQGKKTPCINIPAEQLDRFIVELGLKDKYPAEELENLCLCPK